MKAKDNMKACSFFGRSKLLLADKILCHDFIIMPSYSFRNQNFRCRLLTDIPASMIKGIGRDWLTDHGFSFCKMSSIPVRYLSKSNIAESMPSWWQAFASWLILLAMPINCL